MSRLRTRVLSNVTDKQGLVHPVSASIVVSNSLRSSVTNFHGLRALPSYSVPLKNEIRTNPNRYSTVHRNPARLELAQINEISSSLAFFDPLRLPSTSSRYCTPVSFLSRHKIIRQERGNSRKSNVNFFPFLLALASLETLFAFNEIFLLF